MVTHARGRLGAFWSLNLFSFNENLNMTTQLGSGTQGDLYLGLDLSTQQLKAVALAGLTGPEDDLETHSSFAIHFDSDLAHYRTRGGVTVRKDQGDDDDDGVVTAPVLMWVEALERLFEKMKAARFPFERVVSVSGAAQVPEKKKKKKDRGTFSSLNAIILFLP